MIQYLNNLSKKNQQVELEKCCGSSKWIHDMINAALNAGALGAKIVGSGGGGSITVLAPKNREEHIMKAIYKAGAKNVYIASVDGGARIL